MNIMSINFSFDYDESLLSGGCMLEECSMFPRLDDIFDVEKPLDLSPTNVNIPAPTSYASKIVDPIKTGPAQINSWISEEVDVSLLERHFDGHLTAVLDHSKGTKNCSPGSLSSVDSGMGSPISSYSEVKSSRSSISEFTAPITCLDDGQYTLSRSQLQPISLVVSETDIAQLASLFNTAPAESFATSVSAPELNPEPELNNSSSFTDKKAASELASVIEIFSKPQAISAEKTSKKILTVNEKRERKRMQNRNAATRYREMKRQKGEMIYQDQTALGEKNKNLKDKVRQISQEIEYLKELLIEVYRSKGMVG